MKKLLIFILVISVIFSVVACKGSSSDAMTAKEIMEKTKASYENVKSMTIEMNMNMESDNEMIPQIKMDVAMDVISEPLQFKGSVDTLFGKIEMYGADGKVYIQDPTTKKWSVMDNEQANIPVSIDKSAQFVDVDENILEKLKVSEKEGMYYLTLEGDSDDLMKSLTDMVGSPLPEGTTINNLKMDYVIDKEKFLIDNIHIVGDFDSEQMGEKFNLKIDEKIIITNLNGIEKIEIPKEALDSE